MVDSLNNPNDWTVRCVLVAGEGRSNGKYRAQILALYLETLEERVLLCLVRI